MTSKSHLRLTLVAVAVLVLTALTFVAGSRADAESSALDAVTSLEQGDILTQRGEFEDAREAYKLAEELVRARGERPNRELRRIANAYYFEGRYEEAGAILHDLAEDARGSGDLDGYALALADAIWLFELAGDEEAESELREKIQEISDSPELSEDVRQQIGTDPTGDMRVFAPHLTP